MHHLYLLFNDLGGEDSEAEVVTDVIDITHIPKVVHVNEDIDLEVQTTPSPYEELLSTSQKNSIIVFIELFVHTNADDYSTCFL